MNNTLNNPHHNRKNQGWSIKTLSIACLDRTNNKMNIAQSGEDENCGTTARMVFFNFLVKRDEDRMVYIGQQRPTLHCLFNTPIEPTSIVIWAGPISLVQTDWNKFKCFFSHLINTKT